MLLFIEGKNVDEVKRVEKENVDGHVGPQQLVNAASPTVDRNQIKKRTKKLVDTSSQFINVAVKSNITEIFYFKNTSRSRTCQMNYKKLE